MSGNYPQRNQHANLRYASGQQKSGSLSTTSPRLQSSPSQQTIQSGPPERSLEARLAKIRRDRVIQRFRQAPEQGSNEPAELPGDNVMELNADIILPLAVAPNQIFLRFGHATIFFSTILDDPDQLEEFLETWCWDVQEIAVEFLLTNYFSNPELQADLATCLEMLVSIKHRVCYKFSVACEEEELKSLEKAEAVRYERALSAVTKFRYSRVKADAQELDASTVLSVVEEVSKRSGPGKKESKWQAPGGWL